MSIQYAQQRGILLLSILIITLSIGLLGMMVLQNSQLTMKMTHYALQESQLNLTAHEYLRQIEQRLQGQNLPPCINEQLLTPHLAWFNAHTWQQARTCHDKCEKAQCESIIEILENHVCTIIQEDKALIPTQFYRITVRAKAEHGTIEQIMQSTYAAPSNQVHSALCQQAQIITTLGRQSWRAIDM